MNEIFSSPEFVAEMDRLTGSTERAGNRCTFLPSGVESYRERWRLLAGARSTVHAVAFSVMNDATSKRMTDEMVRLSQAKVPVRLILDDGVHWSTFCQGLLDRIVQAGGEVVLYHKVFLGLVPDFLKGSIFRQLAGIVKRKLKRRFHEKYMVVDGTAAVLGGINWGDKYAFGGQEPKAWRDTDVLLEGPVVADIQDRFVKDWYRYRAQDEIAVQGIRPGADQDACRTRWAAREAEDRDLHRLEWFPRLERVGDLPIRYVAHKPWDEERAPLTNAMLHIIRHAKHEIWWGCHGIRPPRMLAEALVAAAARGVDVRLVTNSRVSARTLMMRGLLGWMHWESAHHYHYLVQGGVKVLEWQKPGAFHSKNLVVDSALASIGSYNLANGSCFHHTESNVFIRDEAFAKHVRAQFEIDFRDCLEITAAQAVAPPAKYDPYLRPLRDRCFLVDRSVWPDQVRADLDAGRYIPF